LTPSRPADAELGGLRLRPSTSRSRHLIAENEIFLESFGNEIFLIFVKGLN